MTAKKCSDSAIGELRHAYELGALSVEDTEKFEIHLLSCESCYEEVARFDQASTLLRTDMDVRREARMAAEAKERQPSLVTNLLRYLWPETPLVFRPAVAFFLLALMIYPAYQGMKDGDSELRQIQSISLIPSRSIATAVFNEASDHDGLISFVFPGAEVGKKYRLVIEDTDGTEVMSIDNFTGFDEYETGRIVVPLGRMSKGTYRLVISDPKGTDPGREQVYVFEVRR
ncbi:MAG: zf-HC2 domain-containing protein [Candidatus Zixiibacteriota bacterium]|nr:MAG: zf-HC2 domain-containing protein [candidate division Zixibacteria bacterium]